MAETPAAERIILAIDTSDRENALQLVRVAEAAGARLVKFGLELSSAASWDYCSTLAQTHGLDWVADAKLDDIPNTVAGAVTSLRELHHPPFAITMHTMAGIEAMRAAQEEAGDIKMLGVTVLTSVSDEETEALFRAPRSQIVMELARRAVEAGLHGVVASSKEVGLIKSDEITRVLFAMIPGTRSVGVATNDQLNVSTPRAAIADGADTLVIGRQITQAKDPAEAYAALIEEIEPRPLRVSDPTAMGGQSEPNYGPGLNVTLPFTERQSARSKYFTSSEAAAYLGCSLITVRRWSDAGMIETFRTPGGQRRYTQEALDRVYKLEE